MRHIEALVIKFIMVSVILELVLLYFTRMTFSDILVVSLAVTIVSYLIGDMLILRFTNNIIATLADLGLSTLTIYLFNFIYNTPQISIFEALIASVVIAVGEWVFHKLVFRLLHWSDDRRPRRRAT